MLNWSLGLGGILGIVLALAGVGLYFLRTVRPNLAREHDIFFAAVALLCGGILLFQSWRLDPILQFAQFLSIGSAIWFAYEAIRLRGITTEQAKRSTPLVDDDRPVSRVYRAELDELTPLDEQRSVTRRIRGSREGRPEDTYEDDRRYGDRDRYDNPNDRRRPRNSRPLPPERPDSENRRSGGRDSWGDGSDSSRSGSGTGMRESIRDNSFSPRTRNNDRPAPSPRRRGGDSDYVDYQPIDFPEDNSNPKDDWR
ncbi:MAG: Ycf66 family protein [Elainella sp.]